MAALDLRCGVDRVWGGETADVLDSFDSEMQQWEEQLQEMQQKIEELYKVVEARRSANDSSPNSNTHLDITLLPVSNAIGCPAAGYRGVNVNDGTAHHNVFNYPSDYPNTACRYGAGSDHTGFPGYETYSLNGGPDVTLDILDGYLGLETGLRRNQHQPCGAPNTSSKENQSFYSHHAGAHQWPATHRIGCVSQGEFEEAQNRRNCSVLDEPRVRHVSWKEPVSCPQTSVSKPAIRQKDGPYAPVRPAHFSDLPPQQDRKCPVIDRKCASPSVLRKFEAMLQENEGKTLIEDGTVTTLVPKSVPKSPKVGGHRASKHAPVQKCLKDSDVPVTLHNGEHRGGKAGVQASHWAPTVQGVELQSDSRMVERILGNCAASQYQVKSHSGANQRNTSTPQQASRESPVPTRRSFSRPARPANQRPPSRWASHTPTAKITAPVGPRSRSLSPACKSQRRFGYTDNFGSYAETVLM
ncbi:uncharacterized protein LOC134333409 [Trichomycterus rosablanca]|uniref:uncharacterized protein LOC134333409 n=1 Tax=Trichomycterus rosablanca TaxID=2290929 RepID=UPI002F352ED3